MNILTWFRKFNLAEFRLPYLMARHSARLVQAVFVLINGFIAIGILALTAMFFKMPFVFPSLGPTAILLFLTPQQPSSSPRSVLWGHAIGISCGYLSLAAFGLLGHPSVLSEGIALPRIFAAALSLGATGGFMTLARTPHPPAGATTLIISLGLITQPYQLVIIEVAVALLVLQAIAINRLAGVKYP